MQKATTRAGVVWCLIFLVLDAAQAVWFGSLLQLQDSFAVSFLSFGIATLASLVWVAWKEPGQYRIAARHLGALFGLNLSVVGAWLCYFAAIQRIEPAVAFMLFTGLIPITTIVAAWFGFPEGQRSRNRLEVSGNGLIVIGMLLLALFTLFGFSGFVRGGIFTAIIGLALAALSGVGIALMLLFSQRLDRHGLGPVAQFGLRFPIYLVCAAIGWIAGIDAKGPVAFADLAFAVALGLLLLAYPIYAVQKAVALTSSLTLAAIAATTPVLVFVLQAIEGRVAFSTATSIGLAVCFSGAMLAVWGAGRAVGDERRPAVPSRLAGLASEEVGEG